ncbi:hypothetical protein ACE6H2_016537 [Prunus campanulata]
MASFAEKWRVLSGENEWEGLLDPLNIDLRRYIIHYGQRAAAISDAFIDRPKFSENLGLSRYAKKNLFSKVGLEIGNPYKYAVKKYCYAATNLANGKSFWLAFVAVSTDEGSKVLGRRDILISWRGTKSGTEEVDLDLQAHLVSASDILGKDHNPKVHLGWHGYYTDVDATSPHNKTASVRDQVLDAVRELVDQYEDEEISITITGHSMGAAIAILNATDIAYNGYNKPTNNQSNKVGLVTAIVFASPRIGDPGFQDVVLGLKNLHVLRVSNDQDPVPKLPIVPFENYVHVGQELIIDTLKSPYLKKPNDTVHELEVYLHGVAGTQGKNNDFKLEVNRDLALVNKTLDGLKDELNVLPKWMTERNYSMAQREDGSWVLDDHEKDDEDDDEGA